MEHILPLHEPAGMNTSVVPRRQIHDLEISRELYSTLPTSISMVDMHQAKRAERPTTLQNRPRFHQVTRRGWGKQSCGNLPDEVVADRKTNISSIGTHNKEPLPSM